MTIRSRAAKRASVEDYLRRTSHPSTTSPFRTKTPCPNPAAASRALVKHSASVAREGVWACGRAASVPGENMLQVLADAAAVVLEGVSILLLF